MRPIHLLSVLLIVVLVEAAACSSPPNVSAMCAAPAQGCDQGLTCDTTVAGGYCTTSCATSGSTSECPEGSICDTLSGASLSCVKICQQQTDCRSDLGCNGVSGSDVKACKIKATAP
jgi:hypothetical protein